MSQPSLTARAVALFLLLLTLPAFGQVDEGDRLYAARAEGADGAYAKPERIDSAIAAYQRALAADPKDIVAHARLLRAYRFKGAHVARTDDQKKQVYGVAKNAGEKALPVVYARLGVSAKTPEKGVADTARSVPGASDVFLWDAVNWGEWAVVYGKMAAARQGAADRIRRSATIALLADPRAEGGAPARVLGRLHDQTPRIPFITGWASSKEALRFLNESLKIDPRNKLTLVFLAEATMSADSSKKPKVLEMLRTVINTPPHPEYAVEDASAIKDAKVLLENWGK